MDNKTTVCDETREEIDRGIVKIENMEPEQTFNPENIGLNFVEVPSMKGYHSNVIAKTKHRRRRRKQSPTLPKHGYSTDLNKSTSMKERFRPIRPKPLQSIPLVLRHKFGSPMTNTTTLSHQLHRFIVPNTVSIKEKIRYIAPLNVLNKTSSCIGSNNNKNVNSDINKSKIVDNNVNIVKSNTVKDNSNIVNIQSIIKEDKINETMKTRTSQDSNATANSNCNNKSNSSDTNNSSNSNNNYSNYNKDLHSIKTISKSHKNSIELFFESMAQTVLNLPNEIQADIKMQICKIITMAEKRYCESQAKPNTEN